MMGFYQNELLYKNNNYDKFKTDPNFKYGDYKKYNYEYGLNMKENIEYVFVKKKDTKESQIINNIITTNLTMHKVKLLKEKVYGKDLKKLDKYIRIVSDFIGYVDLNTKLNPEKFNNYINNIKNLTTKEKLKLEKIYKKMIMNTEIENINTSEKIIKHLKPEILEKLVGLDKNNIKLLLQFQNLEDYLWNQYNKLDKQFQQELDKGFETGHYYKTDTFLLYRDIIKLGYDFKDYSLDKNNDLSLAKPTDDNLLPKTKQDNYLKQTMGF